MLIIPRAYVKSHGCNQGIFQTRVCPGSNNELGVRLYGILLKDMYLTGRFNGHFFLFN